MSIKKTKVKKKASGTKIASVIVSVIAVLGLIGMTAGFGVIAYMLKDKPELDMQLLENKESSVIYDVNGDVIAELGMTIRENVTYDELPNCLIDAFVAVEDSRFFEHNGFDLPRFTRAFIDNIRTMSFSQGGSTFTMQLVKNTFFVNDDTGQQAARSGLDGIKRKIQEIALAFELEKNTSKENIFVQYLNKINFGGNRNIRGVEKASEYYFGKSVKELNLSEAALLAGVINAPTAYNPHNNLEAATRRRNVVLQQMNNHGYITDTEYELARSVKVEDLLVDPYIGNGRGGNNGIPYQAYVDVVVSEIYDLTGLDPYSTTMHVYTYMDPEVQSLMDRIQAGDVDGYFEYPDDEFELASISINNQTGAINGVLGGRNYADGGALLLNHATDQYKQPGSSIKPILDYALAFENLGWSTSHVVDDKPITYPGTNTLVANATGRYNGQTTLRDAVGNSLNTPAIQALQAVINAKGNEYVVDYMHSMGFDNITLDDFNVQYAIGGSTIAVSCKQMAAAQAALMNYGRYITPHTIQRIEFTSEKAPVTPVYNPVQTVSEQSAFLTTELLYSNVNGGYANLMQILIDNYPVYAKTGTTDWGNSGRPYGIPDGSIKDGWMIGSTSEYTVATWIGYEKAQADKQSYVLYNVYLSNIQGRVTNLVLDKDVEVHGSPARVSRPDGIVGITHIIATYPYASPIEGMDPKYITSGLINSQFASLVAPDSAEVKDINGATITYPVNTTTNKDDPTKVDIPIKIEWPAYPDADKLVVAEETMDISLRNSNGDVLVPATGRRLFDYSWVYGPIRYKAEIKVNGQVVDTVIQDTNTLEKTYTVSPNDQIHVEAYYGYEFKEINSPSRVSKDYTVPDGFVTITIPGADYNGKKADLEQWAISNNINMTMRELPASSSNPAGTFQIFNRVTDEQLNPGSSYSFKQSEIPTLQFECAYYVDLFAITVSQGRYPGSDVRLSASTDEPITWTVLSGPAGNDGDILHINNDAKAGDEILVRATGQNSGYSTTATIVVEAVPQP